MGFIQRLSPKSSSMNEPRNLRSCYVDADSKREALDSNHDSTSLAFHETLAAAITDYAECLRLADQVSLFSANETLEDVASADLQYFSLHYQYAQLLLRSNQEDRRTLLESARVEFECYLKLLDTYEILSREDSRTYERYQEDPSRFSTASLTDAMARRNTKIARFKDEKELKKKLEILQKSPGFLRADDMSLRKLQLTNLSLCTHYTFQALESIAQEIQILALAPLNPQAASHAPDPREKVAQISQYSDRLDPPHSQLTHNNGPILSSDGRPLRPFTLLDTRQRLQNDVFRPDHNLPTMSIDEYLEEEKRRGGIIEGGGPKSGMLPIPDEDNFEKADEETMKARMWDEFKEDNPKGAGNTMNIG